jgi:hypothetical protein
MRAIVTRLADFQWTASAVRVNPSIKSDRSGQVFLALFQSPLADASAPGQTQDAALVLLTTRESIYAIAP